MIRFTPTAIVPFTKDNLSSLVMWLVGVDVRFLKEHPHTSPLYASRVRYRAEQSQEHFLSIPAVLDCGFGDCEDLTAWRLAELQLSGIPASLIVRDIGNRKYHVLVNLGNREEDPSRILF